MIYVITSSGVYRNLSESAYRKALGLFAGGLSVSALAGLTLGLAGSVVPPGIRAVIGTVLACAGLAFAVTELLRARPLPLLQHNSEVPGAWMNKPGLLAPFLYGTCLGVGAVSRIGYWCWYAIPIGALLMGNGVAGVAIYGTYGAVRTVLPLLLLPTGRIGQGKRLLDIMLQERRRFRQITSVALGVVSAVTVALVGF